MKIRKTLGIIAVTVFIATMLFAAGCAPKSGSTKNANMSDWEWVPSVWVNNSFTGGKYRNCSYDDYSNGYLCPPGTK
jgi:hypothetical protein